MNRQDGVFLCWRDATLYDTDIEALQTQGSWLNDNHISFAEEVFANDFAQEYVIQFFVEIVLVHSR